MNPQRFQCVVPVLLLPITLALPTTVQAQSELNTPYNLEIVVRVAENRLLTDVFRGQIERELRDGFQAALGNMGHVKVTNKHDRLADVLSRGLRALDAWKDHDDKKTHFVLIDYSGVHYEIQTRQYDGTVGRPSPVIRRDRTRDRDFVAKAAALLLKQDFGIVGTVLSDPEGAKNGVKIELRGGRLGDMSRWVKKDEIFALAPPSGGSSLALRWALLQVERAPAEDAHDGVCECRFFTRYKLPSIAGYRCIKLGTVRTPLRVRWLQRLPNGRVKPLDIRLAVDIRRFGFDGEDTTKLAAIGTDLNGILETVSVKDGVFDNVAFVSVIDTLDDPKPQVPIPLVDDQPVFIEVAAPKDSNSLFTIQKANWQSAVADSLQTQAYLFKRLETLGTNPDNRREIIQLATNGRNRVSKDRQALEEGRQKLIKEATKSRKVLNLTKEDRYMKQLGEYEQVLKNFLSEQEKIEKSENDPQLKKWRSDIQRGKLLEKELQYGEAIELYERVQKEGYPDKDGELVKHLAKLKKDWVPHNVEHKEAQRFIFRIWPTLETARLAENIPTARNALTKCKQEGDLISLQKLLKGTEAHAERLAKNLAELKPDLVIDDEKEYQQLKGVSEQIVKLYEEVQDCLK